MYKGRVAGSTASSEVMRGRGGSKRCDEGVAVMNAWRQSVKGTRLHTKKGMPYTKRFAKKLCLPLDAGAVVRSHATAGEVRPARSPSRLP